MNYEITIEDLTNALCEEQGIILWKDIQGFEGMYQVSNVGGQVKSLARVINNGQGGTQRLPERILKPTTTRCGYQLVTLSKNGKLSYFLVHRLVAGAWVPNPFNLPEVNHIDEVKTSNNAANLEWCDCKHNINWGKSLERRAHTRGKPVVQYTLDGKVVAEYWSVADAARQSKCHESNIIGCCQGKYKQAAGYLWRYATSQKK